MKKILSLDYPITQTLLEHLVGGSIVLLEVAVNSKCPQSFVSELSQAVDSLVNCQRIIGIAVLDELTRE